MIIRSAVMEEASREHHEWHLAQTDPDEFGLIPADEYVDSEMGERTIARLEAVAAKHPGDWAVLANLNSVKAFESSRKQTEPPTQPRAGGCE